MYHRVLLKLSGEALKEDGADSIFNVAQIEELSKTIADMHKNGFQIAIVIGAGNIWRGKLASTVGIDPVPADFMGMLGTVINAVALSSNLKNKFGVEGVVYSAVPAIEGVSVTYNEKDALKSLEEGKIVFCAGGTGKPFFTTDTGAALRAKELKCDAILMGKHGVDGIYTSDPLSNKDAKFIKNITYNEIINKNLKVMDKSAAEILKDTNIKIRVFSMKNPNSFLKVAQGDGMGSFVEKGE